MRTESQQQKYLREVFDVEDAELDAIRAQLQAHDVEHMAISGPEARLLQFLVRACGVRKVVEIGTLFGYSSLAMAKALPEGGCIWTFEKSDENFEIASRNISQSAIGGKIKTLHGDAGALLPSIEQHGPFDLVFIDADKNGYLKYLEWAERNVRRGGFIAGDNTFLFGALWGESRSSRVGEKQIATMLEFNRRLADRSKYNSALVPTQEGLTIAQKL